MIIRKRVIILASLLLLVSMAGVINIVRNLPLHEKLINPGEVLSQLVYLGLFGAGLIFSILEMVRHEITSPIQQLTAQMASLRKLKRNGQRIEFTGNRKIDHLVSIINDMLDDLGPSDHLYRLVADASPDMMCLLDREGCVLFANEKVCQQWKLGSTEIIGKRQEELFPPDIAERHKTVIKEVFDTGQSASVDVHEQIGQQKTWIDARMVPILGKDGHVNTVLGVSRDITERKQMEEALREDEVRYKQLFQFSPDPIIIHDMEMNIIDANIKTTEEFGYSKEELLKKKIFDLHPETELKHSAQVLDAMNKKEMMTVETEFVRKNGSVFLSESTPCKYTLGSKSIIHVVIRDITEKRKIEEDIKKRMNELEIFNDITVGRELKMLELKKEINELLKRMGKKEKYEIVE